MIGIPEATAIILTTAERTELEGLVRSTKTEHRLRQRARIVLLAAEGMASRAIGRAVGCTTGTASKWRVRYAEKRFGGLDETGDRGAEPKYTAETGNAFWRCWISRARPAMRAGPDRSWPQRSATSMCSMSGASCGPEDRSCRAQILVREQRSRVRRQGGRRGRSLHGTAGERDRHLRR